MPTYEYRCPNKHDFERFFRKISDAPTEVSCPQCGEIAERRMSAGAGLLFKGSGFYLTDYGKNAHRGKAPETAGAGAGEGGGGGDSGGGVSESGASESGRKEAAAGGTAPAAAPGSGSPAKEAGSGDKGGAKEAKAPKETKPSSGTGGG